MSLISQLRRKANGGSGEARATPSRYPLESEPPLSDGDIHELLQSRGNSPAEKNERSRVVWVIDDDTAVLALLKSVFGREGFSVAPSGTVSEAVDALPELAQSALVVLDFNIPGGNGLDVLRELRRLSDSPVVMVSNIRRSELVEQAFDLGADDFIEKPFDPRSLVVRARRLMK